MKIFFKIVTNFNYEYIQLIFLRYSLALHFATSLSEKNDKELGFFNVIQIFRWQPWQEYVQTIVECTGAPLEFFLEGTRSRSGKSLPPKIGTWTQTRLLQPWDVLRVQCWNYTIVNHSLYYFNTMSIFFNRSSGLCVRVLAEGTAAGPGHRAHKYLVRTHFRGEIVCVWAARSPQTQGVHFCRHFWPLAS